MGLLGRRGALLAWALHAHMIRSTDVDGWSMLCVLAADHCYTCEQEARKRS